MSLHLPKHHWGTRGMDAYEKLECIGAGTYGQVYMAKDKATGEVVAIKKIRSLNEVQGLPVTTIREIKVLKCLNHANLVELKEVVVSSENDDDDAEFTDKDEPLDYCHGSIYLVLEYLEHDLTGLIDRQHPFDDTEIKCLMKQLLDVMEYMHSIDIIHRDIKCSNLLMTRDHLLKGKTELEQITKIFDICGTPTTESWPDYKFLTHSSTFVPDKPKPKRLREFLMRETTARKRILPKGALELIEALLVLDPEQRLTASDCLNSQYFKARPYAPSDPKKLPPITNLPPSHEYQTKKIRREQAKQLNGGGANNHSNNNTGASGGRASRAASPPGANSGGRSKQNTAKENTKVSVKTEVKREEDGRSPKGQPSSAKKRRRVA
ncbi:hypothetical protein PRIC2_007115 [Phytophthora ramorum]